MARKSKPYISADEDLLTEIRERFDYAVKEWSDTRDEATKDMQYVAGNPWSEKDVKARDAAGRPHLCLDELGQYFNQVINDVRSNPRAPIFSPTGMGASEESAQFYGDKMREIEYRSQAQIAYTTAFQDCVHRSYGWVRINAKFEHEQSFNQDIWIEDVPNPDLVIPDPDATRPTSSDMRYLFYLQSYSNDEFKRAFPDAKIHDFSPEHVATASAWLNGERVQIAEYWKIEQTTKTLYLLQPPATPEQPQPKPVAFFEDQIGEMPPGAVVITSRKVDVPSVCMYLTNGVEILKKPGQAEKKVEWAGSTIPFVSCFGMILYVNDGSGTRRKLLSMTRLARDPFMLYCYARTGEAEIAGGVPKFPYFAYEGQLAPDEQVNIAKSLHEPIALIKVKHTIDGAPLGTILPHPQRNPYTGEGIQFMEMLAESARRAIQSAMGVSFLPTQAQRQNEKSGVALKQIESSGQKGSFHFVDHYEAMIQEIGVKVEDLMDKIIDNARETGVRDAKGTAKMVSVNDPSNPESVSTQGKYSVTVSTGPATESTQQAASDFVDTLVANIEVIAGIAGPKVAAAILGTSIKLKQLGPLGDEIADMITPPEYKGDEQAPPIPPELQQQIEQMQQENAQLKELADKNQTELQKAKLDSETKLEQANVDADKELALQVMKNAASIAVAHISAASKGAAIDAHASEEAAAMGQEAKENAANREHQAQMAERGHQQNLESGEQQALQQQIAMEQEAALQPPPEAGV